MKNKQTDRIQNVLDRMQRDIPVYKYPKIGLDLNYLKINTPDISSILRINNEILKSLRPTIDFSNIIHPPIKNINELYSIQFEVIREQLSELVKITESYRPCLETIQHTLNNFIDLNMYVDEINDDLYLSEELSNCAYDLLDKYQIEKSDKNHPSEERKHKLTLTEFLAILTLILQAIQTVSGIVVESGQTTNINKYQININVIENDSQKLQKLLEEFNAFIETDE